MNSRLVFSTKPYVGITPPETAVTRDVSRYKNDGANTLVKLTRLPSGLWVQEATGAAHVDCGPNACNSKLSTALAYSIWVKVAATALFSPIVTETGFEEPVASPLHPLKTQPEAGTAVS